MLGVGILIAFAMVVSAFVYHKKYNKRRPNAVSNINSRTRGPSIPDEPNNGRIQMQGNYTQRGAHLGVPSGQLITPGEPGVYPSYSAPGQPGYGPYGAPLHPGVMIAPPPYTAPESGGANPASQNPYTPCMMGTPTPPPKYDDILKDEPFPPYPTGIDTEQEANFARLSTTAPTNDGSNIPALPVSPPPNYTVEDLTAINNPGTRTPPPNYSCDQATQENNVTQSSGNTSQPGTNQTEV